MQNKKNSKTFHKYYTSDYSINNTHFLKLAVNGKQIHDFSEKIVQNMTYMTIKFAELLGLPVTMLSWIQPPLNIVIG